MLFLYILVLYGTDILMQYEKNKIALIHMIKTIYSEYFKSQHPKSLLKMKILS